MTQSSPTYTITDHGAVGDGRTDNTAAIARAIDACAGDGGGTVYIPGGTFLTGPVELRSNITLHLDSGATLLFSNDFDDYPTVRAHTPSGDAYSYSALLHGRDLSNIAITGRGVIDGQADTWWRFVTDVQLPNLDAQRPFCAGLAEDHPVRKRSDEFAALNEELRFVDSDYDDWRDGFFRPPLIQLVNCSNVLLSGNTHQNSPGFNTHLALCDNVCVDNVTFLNPADAPNADGLDIDSSRNVRVSNCFFRVKDDCLCLKSGRDENGRKLGRPTENVVVTNCIMDRGHGGLVLGSEMSGGIRNVVIDNCLFNAGVPRGLRIKSNRRRGGIVEDIVANNLIMTNVDFVLTMHAYYGCGVRPQDLELVRETLQPVTGGTPILRNVRLSNITARGVRAAAGYVHGLPEMPVSGVSLNNVVIEMTDDPAEEGLIPSLALEHWQMAGDGFFVKHAKDVSFHDVTISTRQGPSLRAHDIDGLDLAVVKTNRPHADTPIVDIERVTAAAAAGPPSPACAISEVRA